MAADVARRPAAELRLRPVRESEPARTGPRLRARRRWSAADLGWAVVFLGPNLLLFTTFIIVPLLGAFALSLMSWDIVSEPEWVGLDNYARILEDGRALSSILKTFYLVVGGVIPIIVLSFLLAALINTRFVGIRIIRTLYLMPIVISFVASAVLWQFLYDPRYGPINQLLALVGITGPDWLASTTWAMPAVAVVIIWLRLPLGIVLYLAALQQINPSLIEAAKIDGASTFARLRHVLWPSVRPVTLFVTLVTLRGVLFDSFDIVQVMTGGGPLQSTDILINYIYDAAFGQLQLGYASALATVLFLLVLPLTLLVMPSRNEER